MFLVYKIHKQDNLYDKKKMKMLHKVMQQHNNVFFNFNDVLMFLNVMSTACHLPQVYLCCVLQVIPLNELTAEYQCVACYVKNDGLLDRPIVSIGRIQNLDLWEIFCRYFILSPIPSLLFPDLCKLSNTCLHSKEEETAHEDSRRWRISRETTLSWNQCQKR